MHKLLAVNCLNFHEDPIGFAPALELADSKWLAAFRGTLVNNAELRGRMLFKKISEHKLRLSFTVRLDIPIQGHINRLIEVFG